MNHSDVIPDVSQEGVIFKLSRMPLFVLKNILGLGKENTMPGEKARTSTHVTESMPLLIAIVVRNDSLSLCKVSKGKDCT